MSTLLYRIGKLSYAKRWYFIVGWVALLAVIITGISVNGIRMSTEFSLPGTPSQQVMDTLEEQFPAASGGSASVVFTSSEGGDPLTAPANAKAIKDSVTKIHGIQDVAPAQSASQSDAAASGDGAGTGDAASDGAGTAAGAGTGDPAADQAAQEQAAAAQKAAEEAAAALPFTVLVSDGEVVPGVMVSKDGTVAMLQIQFTKQIQELSAATTKDVVDAADSAEKGTNITVLPSDSLKQFGMPVGPTELIGIVVAGFVLFLTLGSMVAAGLPILTALIGVGIGVGATYATSSFVDMNSSTPILAMMIGLAVGIDYALFIVNRQRRLIVREGLTAHEAIARAVGTAGTAVFFAGATVIIALCGLVVIGIGFLTVMALSAALTVAIAVAVAISFLPAILSLFGERICSPKYRAKQAEHVAEQRTSFAEKYVGGLIKRRWLVIVGCVVGLAVVAIPMGSMRLDFPSGASANLGTASRDSYDAIARGFGPGYNGPLIVVAHEANGAALDEASIAQITQTLSTAPDVAFATPAGVSPNGTYATFQVMPKSGPSDEATKDLISTLRDPATAEKAGAELGITGFTAISIDIANKLSDVFPTYVAIILILSLIILLLVFRSIWVPVKATLGFLLSVLATLGATTAVFQWGWFKQLFGFDTGGPLVSFMPIMVTGILFGLAMDYEMFLVSSMREAHVHGEKGRAAVRNGFDVASRVVVAAAVIMVSVFASFVFGGEVMIKQMGFALAIGIVIDAFVVRLTLVPAIMAVLGEKAWWLPKWLDKALPNLDVEGEKLLAQLEAQKPATGEKEPVSV